ITTCIAFAVLVDGWRGYGGRFEFFISVHIAGFVVALIIFLVFLITLENTLGSSRCWNILNNGHVRGLRSKPLPFTVDKKTPTPPRLLKSLRRKSMQNI
ncbi:hypothetical protein QZH41_010415, partial [Actinostola sp. cb2023]